MTKDGHHKPMTNTLAALRQAAGLSSTEVGQRMGVNEQRVRAIEARFPHMNYDTLLRYIRAVGGRIEFAVGSTHINADEIVPDPSKAGTRDYLLEKASRAGRERINRELSRPAEELPLQGQAAEPGGDDTGREVDEPDPERDQGDESHSQQP